MTLDERWQSFASSVMPDADADTLRLAQRCFYAGAAAAMGAAAEHPESIADELHRYSRYVQAGLA